MKTNVSSGRPLVYGNSKKRKGLLSRPVIGQIQDGFHKSSGGKKKKQKTKNKSSGGISTEIIVIDQMPLDRANAISKNYAKGPSPLTPPGHHLFF